MAQEYFFAELKNTGKKVDTRPLCPEELEDIELFPKLNGPGSVAFFVAKEIERKRIQEAEDAKLAEMLAKEQRAEEAASKKKVKGRQKKTLLAW